MVLGSAIIFFIANDPGPSLILRRNEHLSGFPQIDTDSSYGEKKAGLTRKEKTKGN